MVGALTLLLLGRLALLQIVRYDEYTLRAEGNRARIEPLPANRGLILDRSGKVLAENRASYQLEVVREQVPDLEATLQGLTAIGLIPADEIADARRTLRARKAFESVAIRYRLTEEQVAAFSEQRHQFPGVDIQTRSTRHYPYGSLAVHALGYVGTISESDLASIDEATYRGTMLIGKRGVEAAREAESAWRQRIQGNPGQRAGPLRQGRRRAAEHAARAQGAARLGPDPGARPAHAAGRGDGLRGPARRRHCAGSPQWRRAGVRQPAGRMAAYH